MSAPYREATLQELHGVSLRANLAYAVRCARRASPLIKYAPTEPDPAVAAVQSERVIQLAELCAFGAHVDPGETRSLAGQLNDRAASAARAGLYALSAVAHLADAVDVACRASAPDDTEFQRVLVSCYSVSRVLLSNAKAPDMPRLFAALRADITALQALAVDGEGLLGQPVDCSVDAFGPLWP